MPDSTLSAPFQGEPQWLLSPEYSRFMFKLLYSGFTLEEMARVNLLAYHCMRGRISFYAPPSNGIRLDKIDRTLRLSKPKTKAFLADPRVQELFVESEGVLQLRPVFDFFAVYQGARKPIPTATKNQLFERDIARCVYCGSERDLHMDHIWPVSRGGQNHTSNIVVACRSCNLSKSNKTLREWVQNG
jgi:hypothetical protein